MSVFVEEYRGLHIVGDGTYGHKLIKAMGKGGSVPTALLGSYTNSRFARQAIDRIKDMKPLNSRRKNGKETSSK